VVAADVVVAGALVVAADLVVAAAPPSSEPERWPWRSGLRRSQPETTSLAQTPVSHAGAPATASPIATKAAKHQNPHAMAHPPIALPGVLTGFLGGCKKEEILRGGGGGGDGGGGLPRSRRRA
jgi:hypothetical protein